MKMATVHVERRAAAALITLDHPPVNSLSQPTRRALWEAIEAADADAGVQAIVLAGTGRGFCAGGELAELRSPLQQAWPGISNHLLLRIEACAKPVLAAMHGFAIGGGLELAMACHYRIARRGTRIALPEMTHGTIPPSGSQRLPRAVGVRRALDLIVTGEAVAVESFADTSLFDGLCDGDAVAAALEFAAAIDPAAPPGQALLRHRRRPPEDADAALAGWRERLARMPDATRAKQACIDAVEWSVHAADFDAGLAAAMRLHIELSGLSAAAT